MSKRSKAALLILTPFILWVIYVHFYPLCNSYACVTTDIAPTSRPAVEKPSDITTGKAKTPTTSGSETYNPNDGIDAAARRITQALQASDPTQLLSLMTDDVVVINATGGNIALSGKPAVSEWLRVHWGEARHYVSKRYVIHFGFWYVDTSGYEPEQDVSLKLFKYDAGGLRTLAVGEWHIFAIER